MDVRFMFSVPLDDAATIRDRLAKLREETQKKLHATEKKIAAGNAKAMDERKALIATLNRLTPSNFARVIASLGVAAVAKVHDDDLAHLMGSTGLVRGRKKHAA